LASSNSKSRSKSNITGTNWQISCCLLTILLSYSPSIHS